MPADRASVLRLLRDGRWRSPTEMADALGGTASGVASRIRELRTPEGGRHVITAKKVGRGVTIYRLASAPEPEPEPNPKLTFGDTVPCPRCGVRGVPECRQCGGKGFIDWTQPEQGAWPWGTEP